MSTISSGVSRYVLIVQIAFWHYNGTFQHWLRQHPGPDNPSMHLAWHWRRLIVVWVHTSKTSTNSQISLLLWGFQWKDVSMSMTFEGHTQQDKGKILRKWLILASASLDWKWTAFHRLFLITLVFSRPTQKIAIVFMTLHCLPRWISLIMHAHYSWGV